jgi:hypothetical protein
LSVGARGGSMVGRGCGKRCVLMIDLAADYQDMAAAYQTLGYLESGITEPLNRFAEKMLDFSALMKHTVCRVNFAWREACICVASLHVASRPADIAEQQHHRALSPSHPRAPRALAGAPRRRQAARPEAARFRRALCVPLGGGERARPARGAELGAHGGARGAGHVFAGPGGSAAGDRRCAYAEREDAQDGWQD